ncbi:hypothetical protein HJ590_16365 [Naumannella sp. ID2617S]|nr:hypothetical protein [Naumannella sp. ID2617S]
MPPELGFDPDPSLDEHPIAFAHHLQAASGITWDASLHLHLGSVPTFQRRVDRQAICLTTAVLSGDRSPMRQPPESWPHTSGP